MLKVLKVLEVLRQGVYIYINMYIHTYIILYHICSGKLFILQTTNKVWANKTCPATSYLVEGLCVPHPVKLVNSSPHVSKQHHQTAAFTKEVPVFFGGKIHTTYTWLMYGYDSKLFYPVQRDDCNTTEGYHL